MDSCLKPSRGGCLLLCFCCVVLELGLVVWCEKDLRRTEREERRESRRGTMFVVISEAEFRHENQQISTNDASILAVP